jgi:hypothetical protein
MQEDEAIEEALALFEAGAEVVYLAVTDDRILVGKEQPDRPGVVVTARSIHEVRRFLRDLKPDRKT